MSIGSQSTVESRVHHSIDVYHPSALRSKDKECRNEFRRFMGRHPTAFDYKSAQIPAPLTREVGEQEHLVLSPSAVHMCCFCIAFV